MPTSISVEPAFRYVLEAVRELVRQDHTTGQPVARARPKHLAQGLERYRPERYATPRDVKMEAKA